MLRVVRLDVGCSELLHTQALEGKYQGTTEFSGMCMFPISVPVRLGISQWRRLRSEDYTMPFVLSMVSPGGAMRRDGVQAVSRESVSELKCVRYSNVYLWKT